MSYITSKFNRLMSAANNGHIDVVKEMLVENPLFLTFNQETQDGLGYRVLHIAACAGHQDIVEFLLSLPALKVDQKSTNGLMALQIAKNDEIKELLKARPLKDIVEKPINEAETMLNENTKQFTHEDKFSLIEQLQGQGKNRLIKIIDEQIVEEFVIATL